MKTDQRIWIVEDDSEAVLIYKEILDFRYQTEFFSHLSPLQEAMALVSKKEKELPDLLITDLRLPDGNFLDMIKKDPAFRILSKLFLVVSFYDDLDILRACFDEGAIDYLTKPFTRSELVVKVERILDSKLNDSRANILFSPVDGFQFDPETLAIKKEGQIITQLTAKELQIFSVLHREREKKVTRAELQKKVWKGVSVTSKTLDVHLFNLRKKIAKLNLEIRFSPPDYYALIKRTDPSSQK